jgi:hypothetical protein
MDCRTVLEILDCQGTAAASALEGDLAVAEAHLTVCGRCREIVQKRRSLDRKIGRVLRAVDVPRGAQEQLIAKLSAMERAESADLRTARNRTDNGFAPIVQIANSTSGAAADQQVKSAAPLTPGPRRERRWLSRGVVPVAACLAVAAIGFYGAIWYLTPRWSLEEIRLQLARIDFASLDALRDFKGGAGAPADPTWQKLQWRCEQIAKAWPDASGHQFAVYGFVLPGRQRHAIRGLLAAIPRGQMRAPPTDLSLMTAPSSDYLSAQIGESVSVSWTEGDVVYVCLVEGGEDSLTTLKQMLGASAA